MDKMQVRVILKSGAEFSVECSEFNIEEKGDRISGYWIKGILHNTPLFINTGEVAAIIQTNAPNQE